MALTYTKYALDEAAVETVAAADVVIDFFDTGFNVAMLLPQLARSADSLGRLDRDVLNAP